MKEEAKKMLRERQQQLSQAEILLEMHENGVRELREGIENLKAIINEEERLSGKVISETAVNFRSAIDYLLEDTHLPRFYTTKKQMPKLEALNQLLVLAEAWNTFDEFKPDWEDTNQYKHCPIFDFINGKYEFSKVGSFCFISDTNISNFSFKTEERAEQFGKQFIDLFRIVLTN